MGEHTQCLERMELLRTRITALEQRIEKTLNWARTCKMLDCGDLDADAFIRMLKGESDGKHE